jgi:hypothetical protein
LLRAAQMRTLSRDFTASTLDHKDRHWELRLLPQPVYRYESTDPDVLDGAVYAYVTSTGIDPEALLVLEARQMPGKDIAVCHYALARFTDSELRIRHKGKEIFTAPLLPADAPVQDLNIATAFGTTGPFRRSQRGCDELLTMRRSFRASYSRRSVIENCLKHSMSCI